MKTLIFQVCVGEVQPFYKTCIDSVRKYAERIGSDHFVLKEPRLKIAPLKSARSENALRLGYLPVFEKEVAFSAEYLDNYDKIVIIDSDVFVRDVSPNIFDEIDSNIVFAGVREMDMPITDAYTKKIQAYSKAQYGLLTDSKREFSQKFGYEFYNMGIMLFTNKLKDYLNEQTPEQFIRRPEFERFVNGLGSYRWSTDQTLLNYWIRKINMPTKNLDWRWNALFKGVKDEVLKKSYFIHFVLSSRLPQQGREIPEIVKNLDKAFQIRYKHK